MVKILPNPQVYQLLKVVLHWQLVFVDHLQVVSKHMRCYSVSNVVVPRMEEDISGTDGVKNSKRPSKPG